MKKNPRKDEYQLAIAIAKSALNNNPWHAFAEDLERVIEHCKHEIDRRTVTCGVCEVRCDNSWCVTYKTTSQKGK
jgi:hypothetical protein